MNAVEQHVMAPQSESEWIAQGEDLERIEARCRRTLEMAFEYGPDLELREFRGCRRIDPLDDTGCTDQEIAAGVRGGRLVDEYFSRVRT